MASRSHRASEFTAATRSSSESWDGKPKSVFMAHQYHINVREEDHFEFQSTDILRFIC